MNVNNLYRIGSDLIKKKSKLDMIIIVSIILGVVNYFLAYRISEPVVNIYNEKEQTSQEIGFLYYPILNEETLLNNVNQALFETFNFDSLNYEDKIPDALNKWYTKQGAKDVFNNLNSNMASGGTFIDFLVNNRITSQAHILPGTFIIKRRFIAGTTAWHIGARMLLTYRNEYGYSNSNFIDVSIWVRAIHPSENANSLGIISINFIK